MSSVEFVKMAKQISLNKREIDFMTLYIKENRDLFELIDKNEALIYKIFIMSKKVFDFYLSRKFKKDIHPILNLYFVVIFSGRCRDRYVDRGIDLKVFTDSMSDINVWSNGYFKSSGKVGLTGTGWVRKSLMLELFKLGRLQFEVGRLDKNIGGYPVLTRCLYIHIPEGEKLDITSCQASLDMAKGFYKTHYKKEYNVAACHSWLLNENLKRILDKDSNIIKFSELFNFIKNEEKGTQAMERVFGNYSKPSVDMPENSSLQKKMKSFLLSGNTIGLGYGIVEL
ncbi:MAG: acyltransferase domain-containing protein [Spirochaetaceae bacterium]